MGKGGRFGKYGEHKRLERLRQKPGRITKVPRDLSKRKTPQRYDVDRSVQHHQGK